MDLVHITEFCIPCQPVITCVFSDSSLCLLSLCEARLRFSFFFFFLFLLLVLIILLSLVGLLECYRQQINQGQYSLFKWCLNDADIYWRAVQTAAIVSHSPDLWWDDLGGAFQCSLASLCNVDNGFLSHYSENQSALPWNCAAFLLLKWC